MRTHRSYRAHHIGARGEDRGSKKQLRRIQHRTLRREVIIVFVAVLLLSVLSIIGWVNHLERHH